MKCALALLLTIYSAVVYAQTIYHCEDGRGHAAFQDSTCIKPSGANGAHQPRLNESALPIALPAKASFEVAAYSQDGSSHPQHAQRNYQTKAEARAETLRMSALLLSLKDSRAAEYADNHRRCVDAMRVAQLCGQFAGMFSCDEKGFHQNSIAEAGAPRITAANSGGAFKVEQCALEAAK